MQTIMKKMKFLTYATFVLFLGLAISSCEGPEGPAGAAGANGTNGTNGTDGTDGNANVIYSDWIIPTWEQFSEFSVNMQKADLDVTDLTQDVLDNGVVLVYWKNWQNLIRPLPFTFSDIDWLVQFQYSLNLIRVSVTLEDSTSTYPPSIPSSNTIRYIIIPGSTETSSRINIQQTVYNELADAAVDVNDYYAVCAYYGINPK
jgi:hypothetical protein